MSAGAGHDGLAAGGVGGSAASSGLTSHQLRLLGLMAEAARLTPEAFLEGVVKVLPGVSGLADLDDARFRVIADGFVAIGFRHPALPLLSAAQRACLDRCRRRLGLSGREALALFRNCTGVVSRRRMTGGQFLGLMAAFNLCNAAEPLPAPGFMTRQLAGRLRRKAWLAGVDDDSYRDLLMKFGGTTATHGLDERAFHRVMIRLGPVEAEPAPRVDGDPGMVTQAQANVIWRLWHEARRGRDVSQGKLDVAIRLLIGLPGGLDTLTRAGARAVMDRFKASLITPLDLSA